MSNKLNENKTCCKECAGTVVVVKKGKKYRIPHCRKINCSCHIKPCHQNPMQPNENMKCPKCQFEGGSHSFECPDYKVKKWGEFQPPRRRENQWIKGMEKRTGKNFNPMQKDTNLMQEPELSRLEEVKEDLKEIIKSWKFATCPVETKEPFFWKWNEHGLEMLECYIHSLLSHNKEELRKKIRKIKERFRCAACDGSKCEHTLGCQAIDDILNPLK